MKYNVCQKIPAYTFSSLDDELAENVELIALCIMGENKAMEMANAQAQFTQENLR